MAKMKATVIVFLILAVSVLAWFFFTKSESQGPKFFPKEQISSSDVKISITPEGFNPKEVTVKKGERVVWINESNTYAWPASDLHPTHERYPEFDPKEPVPANEAWAFRFDKIGGWLYHDHLKPNRRAIVKVE